MYKSRTLISSSLNTNSSARFLGKTPRNLCARVSWQRYSSHLVESKQWFSAWGTTHTIACRSCFLNHFFPRSAYGQCFAYSITCRCTRSQLKRIWSACCHCVANSITGWCWALFFILSAMAHGYLWTLTIRGACSCCSFVKIATIDKQTNFKSLWEPNGT